MIIIKSLKISICTTNNIINNLLILNIYYMNNDVLKYESSIVYFFLKLSVHCSQSMITIHAFGDANVIVVMFG